MLGLDSHFQVVRFGAAQYDRPLVANDPLTGRRDDSELDCRHGVGVSNASVG